MSQFDCVTSGCQNILVWPCHGGSLLRVWLTDTMTDWLITAADSDWLSVKLSALITSEIEFRLVLLEGFHGDHKLLQQVLVDAVVIVINTCFLYWAGEIVSDCRQVERGSHIGEKNTKPLLLCLLALWAFSELCFGQRAWDMFNEWPLVLHYCLWERKVFLGVFFFSPWKKMRRVDKCWYLFVKCAVVQ